MAILLARLLATKMTPEQIIAIFRYFMVSTFIQHSFPLKRLRILRILKADFNS